MGAIYQTGGFLIIWTGIVGLSMFGLCLGAALGKIIYARVNGRPEDIKLGWAVYIGLPRSLLSGLIQFLVTLGVPVAFFLTLRHIAQTNFGAFLSFR